MVKSSLHTLYHLLNSCSSRQLKFKSIHFWKSNYVMVRSETESHRNPRGRGENDGIVYRGVAMVTMACNHKGSLMPRRSRPPGKITYGVLNELSRHRHLCPLEFQRVQSDQFAAFNPSVKLPWCYVVRQIFIYSNISLKQHSLSPQLEPFNISV